jgi:protein-L-isoaspartate(D-aspartate) O-methyltransferase
VDRLADFRKVFAELVVAKAGCPSNQPLLDAFGKVPRHEFLGDGPWVVREDGTKTISDDPALAYQDMGFGLARDIPTGLPSLHAALLDASRPQRGERVVHVGAGTGYYTAILAELVGSSGQVEAFEIDAELAARARSYLRYSNVTVEAKSGVRAVSHEVDLIYVNAGVQQMPRQWIDALSSRGRVVCPLVGADGAGGVFAAGRRGARFICRARFVPCVGTLDAAAEASITAAFRDESCASVRSLRLDCPPDSTAWFAGDGWWLSSAAATGE